MNNRLFFTMILTVALLFISMSVASATDYYVAKDGSDSDPGSESEPWLTIQKAADTLVFSDTVYIKEGTYNEQVIPQNSGNAGNYITYTAYPSHTVTIDGTGTPTSGLFRIENKNYIKVSGLRIENYYPEDGARFGVYIYNDCDHIIIENNFINNTGGCGIYAYSGQSSNIVIDNNDVSYTNLDIAWWQEAISLASVNTFTIKNNHVHNLTHIGIDAKANCLNGEIYGNHVHDIVENPGAPGHPMLGIYIDGAYDIDIYKNVVHDTDGSGIVLGLERPTSDDMERINIYNNIVYGTEYGVLVWAASQELIKDIKIINNDCYNNIKDGILIADLPIENLTIRNNILSENNRYQIQILNTEKITGLAVDHNLINGPTQFTGDDYIEGNPKFVNPVAGDFHLQSDSPAIDSGSSVDAPGVDYDGNPRPQGAGYDIGAYEFCGYNVTGYVTYENTTPASNVYITNNVTALSNYTDADGFYILTILNGSYAVKAEKFGYFSNSTDINVSGADIENVNITLGSYFADKIQAQSLITVYTNGTYDYSEEPIDKAITNWTVLPLNNEIVVNATDNSTVIITSTGANQVWLNTTIHALANKEVQLIRNSTPVATTDANATGFISHLYTGGFSTYEFKYQAGSPPAGNVSGFVYSTDTNSIQDAVCYLSYTNGSYIAMVNTSADGSYNFTNLESGDYYIFAKEIGISSDKSNATVAANITTWCNLTLYHEENNIAVGKDIFIDLSGSFDFEGDTLNYSCNRTDLFTDFNTATGKGNWTNVAEGTHPIKFGISDDVGYSNKTVIFNVSLNRIITGANEWILFNNWSSASQIFSQIAANESNDLAYSYYNSTSGLWESYWAGYNINQDNSVPKNESLMGYFDAITTIACDVPSAEKVTIPANVWFYTYLREGTSYNLTQINTSIVSDGCVISAIYGFQNDTQAYNSTGSYTVSPNEGFTLYATTGCDWDGGV